MKELSQTILNHCLQLIAHPGTEPLLNYSQPLLYSLHVHSSCLLLCRHIELIGLAVQYQRDNHHRQAKQVIDEGVVWVGALVLEIV